MTRREPVAIALLGTGLGPQGPPRTAWAHDSGRRILPILLALLLAPTPAWSHAYLVKSAPARRAVLLRAPARVQLWFNERLEPRFSRVSVWDREGKQVDSGDVQVGPDDATRLSVGVSPLAPGTYTVKFRVLSVDGHVVEEEFPFRVRGSQ